jgi:chaperonin GroES
MAEQGMKIFSGIFKRTYRSLKSEFRKLYRLNQLYMIEDFTLGTLTIPVSDYNEDSKSIVPAADPNMVSDSQKLQQAQMLLGMSQSGPGFDVYQVQKRMLQALKVEDIEQVLPDPKGPNAIQQAPHYKVQEAQVKAEVKGKEIESKMQIAMMELQQAADLNAAKIAEMEAKAIKLQVEAAGVDAGHQIAKMQLELQARKQQQEGIMKSLELMQKAEKDSKAEAKTQAS